MQKKNPKVFLFVDNFDLKILSSLNKNVNIIYRNYKKKINKSTLLSIKKYCKFSKRKFYLSNDAKLAIQLNLDGVYIPSFNKKINFKPFITHKKFEIIGSAHNKQEIHIKKLQGCDLIFLSPIFRTEKTKKFLGIIKFNLLTLNENKKFVALGGVKRKNFKKIRLTRSVGYSGISWIKKNGPRINLRPF